MNRQVLFFWKEKKRGNWRGNRITRRKPWGRHKKERKNKTLQLSWPKKEDRLDRKSITSLKGHRSLLWALSPNAHVEQSALCGFCQTFWGYTVHCKYLQWKYSGKTVFCFWLQLFNCIWIAVQSMQKLRTKVVKITFYCNPNIAGGLMLKSFSKTVKSKFILLYFFFKEIC